MTMTLPCNSTSIRFWNTEDGRVFDDNYALDTETTLIDNDRPWIIPALVVVGVYDGQTAYMLTRETTADFLRLHDDLHVIMHHAPFDLAVLQQAMGNRFDMYELVERNLVRDTQILHRLYRHATVGNAELAGSSLAACASLYLGLELDKEGEDGEGEQVRKGFGQYLHDPEKIPETHVQYLLGDIRATFLLFEDFKQRFPRLWREIADSQPFGFINGPHLRQAWLRFGPLTHHIQLKAAIVLNEISRNGLVVDKPRLEPFRLELEAELSDLQEEMLRHGYRPGSKGCKKALQRILRDIEVNYPEIKFPRTDSGYISEAAKNLEEHADTVPFLSTYLRAAAIKKLLSTFLVKMQRGILHPTFDVLKNTGRTSAFGDISAQNLPRDERLRGLFVPTDGHVFFDADYSAVEMATLSQCTRSQFGGRSAMGDAINAGADLHRLIAARMTGKPEAQITKDERQKAKAVNFGFPGGMGLKTFRSYAKTTYGADLSEADAEALKNVWFNTFPEMRQFLGQSGNLGEDIADLLGITTLAYAEATGQQYVMDSDKKDMLGWMARKVFTEHAPATKNGRYYTDEEQEYFWQCLNRIVEILPQKHRQAILDRIPSPDLVKSVCYLAGQASVLTLTGRCRAAATYCARHNTVFQGLAADGAKLAMWKLWRAGFRIVNFIHDEFLIELPEQTDYVEDAEAIRRLMIEGMREVVPDIKINVEYAVSRRWSKAAEAKYDEQGRLIPYEDSVESD